MSFNTASGLDLNCIIKIIWVSMQSLQIRQRFVETVKSENCIHEYFLNSFDINTESFSKIERDLLKLHNSQVNFTTYFDLLYPDRFKQISDPPLIIFFKGELESFKLDSSTWGIVGARKASIFGLHLASRIAKLLAEHQQKIISGLAMGIDASAHQGALDSGQISSTLAVLGNGLPKIYPTTNQSLATKIIRNKGVILSQFYPFSPAYPTNFLNRNRLIAGLSDNLLVIEASEQSGSRVTARYALEQGKNLYVIPGDIANPNYKGSNQLIKNGAEIITCIEDFYDFLPKTTISRCEPDISMPEQLLLAEIRNNNGINRQELKIKAFQHGISGEVFHQELIILENNQKIKVLPGDFIQVY